MRTQNLYKIFTVLNQKNIKYCSWKGNSGLFKSFNGEKDFDLLVSIDDKEAFKKILSSFNYKKRYSTFDKIYAGTEDYIGIDSTNGKMFHLHVYYKLIIGKKFKKNYRIPIEELVLSTSILDENYPIKIIKTEIELLLRIIRIFLKIEPQKSIYKKMLSSKIYHEFELLNNKIDNLVFNKYAEHLFPEISLLFKQISEKKLENYSIYRMVKNKIKIMGFLKRYRIYSEREIQKESKIRKIANNHSKSWTSPGGLSIAFVGADGSGKSSTVSNIENWLGWKLWVRTAYMGIPKNISWKVLDYLIKVTKKLNFGFLKNILDIIRSLFAAKSRYKNYVKFEMKKNQGAIVLFDRYPMNEFWSMEKPMDGPRLVGHKKWDIVEKNIYDKIDKPDYVIILKVSVDDALERKNKKNTELDELKITKKIEGVEKLIKKNMERHIVIDTSNGQRETLLEIKRHLWRLI